MNTYFEVTVRYDKATDQGTIRRKSESFIVEAYSFTEAEARIIQEMQTMASGDFEITAIKKAKYSEIVFDKYGLISQADGEVQKITGMNSKASGEADKWYRVKVNMPDLDDNKEKKTSFNLLVNAGSVNAAHDTVVQHMRNTFCDYEIGNIDETKIMDCFFYEMKEETCESASKDIPANEEFSPNTVLSHATKKLIESLPVGDSVTISAGGISTTIRKEDLDTPDKDG